MPVPRLSKIFGLNATQGELDFVDISTDRDTRLFLEPFAISLRDDAWSEHCKDHLISFFDAVVQAIRGGNDDRALALLDYVWDPTQQEWHPKYADLPVAKGRHVIMVPKFSVRRGLLLRSQEFYSHYVLDFLQQQELLRGSNLVHLLKNGTRKVYKKDLKQNNPFSKEFLAQFASDNPKVLEGYKDFYRNLPDADGALSDEDIDSNFSSVAFAQSLMQNLPTIPLGSETATQYHRFMLGALEFIFYPHLIYPEAEQKLHQGRKRIDIWYTNAARNGFFERVRRWRLGREEHVRAHTRRWPNQYSFGF
jgi:hypothetical protein